MSGEQDFEEDRSAPRTTHGGPHSGKHPIPTVQGYRQQRKELEGQVETEEKAQEGPEDESKPKRAFKSAKAIFKDQDPQAATRHDPYPSTNHNYVDYPPKNSSQEATNHKDESESRPDSPNQEAEDHDAGNDRKGQDEGGGQTATEAVMSTSDPKEKRKIMKKKNRHGGGREVTDPVTHLPIKIHDKTDKDLNSVPENKPEPGTTHDTATGPQGASKTEDELRAEQEKMQRGINGMQRVFPPPDFDTTRQELAALYQKAMIAGLAMIGLLSAVLVVLPIHFAPQAASESSWGNSRWIRLLSGLSGIVVVFGSGVLITIGLGRWIHKRTSEIFEDEVWDSARREELAILEDDEELPESTQWLNSLISSIWPLINPDLFASLVDQIEDVMQASLPKVIRMVSVDDMGQGSEAIRILGVRWLPTGAASRTVESNGKLGKDSGGSQNDRTDPGNTQDTTGENDSATSDEAQEDENKDQDSKQQESEEVAMREGMEAEEGDFVNLELALAYRSRPSGHSFKSKVRSAHLYLKFYLPGGIAIPVWVQLRGIVMTVRLRLQLTPDPPFISLCTLTFLGQPKASMSCVSHASFESAESVPLSKHSISLTDVPLISSFVNSAIDAALAEYVAPKSLTLNLKDMLVGEDYKKDTVALGVVFIFIRRASGFKQGDGGFGPTDGSSDSYVTVSWGKFGKPVGSTRIISGENDPSWHEYASILVTPEEVNAQEKLRLQLWDSDKWSADDDLGRVEVDLKSLMRNSESQNKMQDREDRFTGEDVEEEMPGSLLWSVGYFAKTTITQQQYQEQTVNKNIRSKEDLKQHISDAAENKLRESGKPADDEEVRQQKTQDYRELETSMIVSAPPSDEFPSGILSVQIHNITGLETQNLQKQDKGDRGDSEDEAEQASDLPDSYCTIILNHKKIFRTRTKPKNSKPFFNAGTERFIRNWRDAEVIVSVRDSRESEDDPLIGLVYLPLHKVFQHSSQANETYSIVGGIGYGRARISMVWRSVELKLPQTVLGWEYGTIQIRKPVSPKAGLDSELVKHRLKVKTNMGRLKLYSDDGCWKGKGGKTDELFLPVRKRYSSSLIIEFRSSSLGADKTPAFACLWLNELQDEVDEVKSLKVWKGSKDGLRKAQSCAEYNGLSEEEQPLGEIEVPIRFWRGLSGFHKEYAAHSKNTDVSDLSMRDVMECLDTISDEALDGDDSSSGSQREQDSDSEAEDNDATTRKKKLTTHTNDDSTPPSSDDEDGGDSGPLSSASHVSLSDFKKVKNIFRNPVEGVTQAATKTLAPGHNDPNDGSRGVRASLRDYKDHHKQLHRKHRGIMQWRAARGVDHLGGKLTRMKGNISQVFHHGDKETGIETEV
ncbi:hypothetical protein F5Y18DRAFT_433336 [Xylariaceae sp. FL1019]|nr:hypothetical protein F5Y18DRAFT_433336 [Xylariaceae sp. FL1019]